MNLRTNLLLLVAVALLTPVAAVFGLYETSMDEVLAFLGPVAGAVSAIYLMQMLRRR